MLEKLERFSDLFKSLAMDVHEAVVELFRKQRFNLNTI
jgi:hypothetical protein